MFSRLALFSMLALPLFAAATPAARNDAPTTACCSSTIPASSKPGEALLGLLGVALSDLDVALGLNCSPISIIGVGSGSACSGSTVSCTNGVVGSIGIGCVPVSL